jgi:tRNA-dihydrouridine synthase B
MITESDFKKKLILLAPMAGVTDKPFRQLCREMGAHGCVSEMITSNSALYDSAKSRMRMDFRGEVSPRIVQIAGADPVMMAEATRINIHRGAEVIDINMGCPAKKVCKLMAGSALLRNERLVQKILHNVVKVSSVPVSLKIRTGWDRDSNNAVRIARIAESEGISRITVHGRSRADRFEGRAEHETTAEVKSAVSIEVIANGDITSAQDVRDVLIHTGADGVMIGRAARGKPWIFTQIRQFMDTGKLLDMTISRESIFTVLRRHLREIYQHYGEAMGVRIARKHIYWYCGELPGFEYLRRHISKQESARSQLRALDEFFKYSGETQLAA